MRKYLIPLSCLIAFFVIGCSTTKLTADYPAEIQGTGGAKETVDGIDIWVEGTPYRKYKILSVVDDNGYTRGNLLMSHLSQSGAKGRLLKAAKEVKADGIIYLHESSTEIGGTTTGHVGNNGSVTASSVSKAIVNRRAALVKYL